MTMKITVLFRGLALGSVLAAAGVSAAATPAAERPFVPAAAPEALPQGAVVKSLAVEPASVRLEGVYDAAQLVVTATLFDGTQVDVSRFVR